jgi:hypothetical protein
MKKCAPGVICIENITMLFIIICTVIVCIIFITIKSRVYPRTEKVVIQEPSINFIPGFQNWFGLSWPYNNNNLPPPSKDIIGNPYVPPLRDERYLINDNLFFGPPPPMGQMGGRVPINIPTNIGAVDTQYRQLGLLTPLNGSSKDNILPLMGRPLFTNRNMWNYFTTGNQHNNIKLPVSRKGKSCTNEYGCDKLYNGDTVYIEGINEPYRVTEYDNDTIRYLPFV